MTSYENYPRDMIGYGRNPPHPHWPGQARIALQFVLNYEEGGENNVLHGDAGSETFLSEIIGAQSFPMRHMSMETLYEYGSRAGLWRILRIFEDRKLPLTVFGVAMALKRNPEAAAAFKELGHEIACHGLRWISYQNMDEDTERAHMREADHYGDDLPFWTQVEFTDANGWHANRPQLVVPYTLDTNDMRFAAMQGFNSGTQFFDYLKDAFDTLYAEGDPNGLDQPKMLSIGLHCRLVGRPARAAALARFLDYVQRHNHVWITRRIDIARHWQTYHPFKAG
jgi:allantoinase